MGWCTVCCNMFLLTTGQRVNRSVTGRSSQGFVDVVDGVCGPCKGKRVAGIANQP